MFIRNIAVSNVRNITTLSLEFDSKFNFFWGENGAGKTSMLEALFFIVSGRSFRTARLRNFIQQNQQQLSLFACVSSSHFQRDIKIGVRKHLSETLDIKFNGEVQTSLIPIAQAIPMQVIAPDRSSLIDDDAETRRRFIDWGVFHVEHDFSVLWKKLRHVVKQRNALLKQRAEILQIESWNTLLSSLSLQIQKMRALYIKGFESSFHILLPDSAQHFEIILDQGWPTDRSLDECLRASLTQDKRLGYSQFGAHRADLKLLYNGQIAKSHLSRGQRKLFNIYLAMAHVHCLYTIYGKRTVCLIDDLASELDSLNRKFIYQCLNSLQSQVFITGITVDPVLQAQNYKFKLFHVEQGCFRDQPSEILERMEELTE